MCGRFALTSPPEAVRAVFGFEDRPNFPPRYNIAPTQPVGIVRAEAGQRRFRLVRWGLIPAWAKDPARSPLLINARAEEAAGKPAFRAALRRRRCLVPADGFYEWKREGRAKQPFWIASRRGGPIALAGLWERWPGPEGEEMESMAILTTAAPPSVAPIHARVPVVIGQRHFAAWLDVSDEDLSRVAPVLASQPVDLLVAIPVGTRVNSVANDDPTLQDPLAPDCEEEPLSAIGQLPLL